MYPARHVLMRRLTGLWPRKYDSMPEFPLANTPALPPPPSSEDLLVLTHLAWRGLPCCGNVSGKSQGSNGFLGRDLLQWLMYHLGMPDTPIHNEYATQIAERCLSKRYINRVVDIRRRGLLSPFRFAKYGKKHSGRGFKDNHTYNFNPVTVSRLHLVVLVQSANDLQSHSRSGTSNPVAHISLGGSEQSHSTTVISKTCYPVWNQVFTFGVKDTESQQLIFRVFDYDKGKEDDFLGYAAIPLHEVPSESYLMKLRDQVRSRADPLTGALNEVSTGRKGDAFDVERRNSPSQTLNSSTNSFRAEAVTATFRQSGGILHDVDALFESGAFDGAMREIKLGYGGNDRRIGVKGTIRVGAFLRECKPSDLLRRMKEYSSDSDDDDTDGGSKSPPGITDAHDNQKYQLYCHVLHGKGIKELAKTSLKVGNYVPGLQWMNRVCMRVQDNSVYTNYVLKTSGPIWGELISLEVSHITERIVRLRMYQCSSLEASSLAANTLNRFVGEVAIPLSMIRIISASGTSGNDGHQSASHGGMTNHADGYSHRHRHVDPSLHAAAAEDELLSSVDLRDIPEPSMMPLVFSWQEKGFHGGSKYKKHNGELMMSIWMVPKGGSLFGDAVDDDILDEAQAFSGQLSIPNTLEHVVADAVVPMPVAVLRRELWGKQDSASMFAHLEEKDFKNIEIGKWYDDVEEGALLREVSYLLPGSFGIAAMNVYEKQRIYSHQDVSGGFVVQCRAQAPEVAYGRAITTCNQFVFQWVAPRQTRVQVSCQVEFNKKGRPPGFICSQIVQSAKKGAKESSELLIDMLSSSGGGATKRRKKKKDGNSSWMRWLPKIIAIAAVVIAILAAAFFSRLGVHGRSARSPVAMQLK